MNSQTDKKVNWWFYILLFVIVTILIILIIDRRERYGDLPRSQYDKVIAELRKGSSKNSEVSPEQQAKAINQLRSESKAKPVSDEDRAQAIDYLRNN